MKLKITIDDKSYEVDVEAEETAQEPSSTTPYAPAVQRPNIPAAAPAPSPRLASAPSAPGAAAADGNVAEDKVCRSPIMGIVVGVNIQAGQQVQANDALLVLEAMKMETTITSPVSGKVKTIRVQQGESVQANQIVVDFE